MSSKTPSVQFVDEEVTKQKFAEEVSKFEKSKDHYRKLGVVLVENSYPDLVFYFFATALKPICIVFAVKINFTNYDTEPLSLTFIDPLTFAPVLKKQMMTFFRRKTNEPPGYINLLQADADDVPFVCIPGIREYHSHVYHDGDSWFLYRQRGGEGSLCFLLDNLQLYGTSRVIGFQLTLQTPHMNIISNGFPE